MTMSHWGCAVRWTTPGGTGEVGGTAAGLPSVGISALSHYDSNDPAENPNLGYWVMIPIASQQWEWGKPILKTGQVLGMLCKVGHKAGSKKSIIMTTGTVDSC